MSKRDALQALAHLAAVHAAGVLHGDVHSGVVMLRSEPTPSASRVCLVDFSQASVNREPRQYEGEMGLLRESLADLCPELSDEGATVSRG